MKCVNCGFESQDNFKFCPICGVEAADTVCVNPAAEKALAAIKDKLFLVLCILMSVSCVFSMAANSFPLISILITIFLWLTYAKGCKGIADRNHLRCISGSVYAYYVIINVACIILIVCGIIVSLALGLTADKTEILDAVKIQIGDISPDLEALSLGVLTMIGWLIGLVFLVVAVVFLLINNLGIKKIHRFVKSVYVGIDIQNPVCENPRAAKNWLIVLAVFSAVSAFSNVLSFFASGSLAAAIIIAIILINKYFPEEVQN